MTCSISDRVSPRDAVEGLQGWRDAMENVMYLTIALHVRLRLRTTTSYYPLVQTRMFKLFLQKHKKRLLYLLFNYN
jgi:hypothetical protein